MPDEHDTVRVVIAAPLAPELCDRIAAVDPRVEVVVDQELLPPMRHAADFSGERFQTTSCPKCRARLRAMGKPMTPVPMKPSISICPPRDA